MWTHTPRISSSYDRWFVIFLDRYYYDLNFDLIFNTQTQSINQSIAQLVEAIYISAYFHVMERKTIFRSLR